MHFHSLTILANTVNLISLKGVGKSSLIKQYICEMCPSDIAPTIGASFSTFKIKLEEGKVKMQVQIYPLFYLSNFIYQFIFFKYNSSPFHVFVSA